MKLRLLIRIISIVFILSLIGCGGIKNDNKRSNVASLEDKSSNYERDGSMAKSEPFGQSGNAIARSLQEEKVLALPNIIYFNYDSAIISEEYDSVLESHSSYLVDNPSARAVLEGHTDERGTREYNLALGERRAMSIKKRLSIMGVKSNQIQIISFGEEKPETIEQSEDAYTLNRRVEIVY